MTRLVRDAWRESVHVLRERGVSHPTRESRWILSAVLQTEPSRLYLFWDTPLAPNMQKALGTMLEKRSSGFPLQYTLGEWEFMSCVLQVREGVFIPRLDTEAWVEEVISWARKHLGERRGRLLDLCCGSGAITCACAFWIPGLTALGVDNSSEAVQLARVNAKKVGVQDRTRFIVSDLYTQCPVSSEQRFDIIVSNPPYIRDGDWPGLPDVVRCYEPKRALVGGKDGMDFIRRILAKGREFLEKDGIMVIEHAPEQERPLREIIQQDSDYQFQRVITDYSGQVRSTMISTS